MTYWIFPILYLSLWRDIWMETFTYGCALHPGISPYSSDHTIATPGFLYLYYRSYGCAAMCISIIYKPSVNAGLCDIIGMEYALNRRRQAPQRTVSDYSINGSKLWIYGVTLRSEGPSTLWSGFYMSVTLSIFAMLKYCYTCHALHSSILADYRCRRHESYKHES